MEEKMSLFSQFINSISSFESYKYFIRQSLGRAFLYLFLLSIVFGGISGIKFISGFNNGVNEVVRDFESGVPDFQLKNGELEVNAKMPYIIAEDENEIIIIDTSGNIDETVLDDYERGTFISKYEVVNKENMVQTRKFNFSSFQEITITKENIIGWLPFIKWFGIIIIVFGFVFYLIGKFISALILSVCGLVIQEILKYKVGFKNLYKISIYALTIPILINTLLDIAGLTINYFTLVYYGIGVLYIWMAIKALKQDTDG